GVEGDRRLHGGEDPDGAGGDARRGRRTCVVARLGRMLFHDRSRPRSLRRPRDVLINVGGSDRRSPRHPPPVAGRADSLTLSESTSGGASAAPPDTPHRSPGAPLLWRALRQRRGGRAPRPPPPPPPPPSRALAA